MTTDTLFPGLRFGARILFMRLRSLGDMVLTTPVYAALRAWRPDLRISVVAEQPNDEALFGNSDIDEIITIAGHKGIPGAGLTAKMDAMKRIRAERYDCCINLHGGPTSAWMTFLSNAAIRVGRTDYRNGFCYDMLADPSVSPDGRKPHTVEFQTWWMEALGMPKTDIPPLKLTPDPVMIRAAAVRLSHLLGGSLRPFAVVQPAVKMQTKQWTAEGFAAVADYLSDRLGFDVILCGGPGELSVLDKVASACRIRPVVLCPASVTELISFISTAGLFIGNDSGPAHIAAALQVPLVVLFGPTDHVAWAPWMAEHRIVRSGLPCSPCRSPKCRLYPEPACMNAIEPKQVIDAINSLTSGRHYSCQRLS